MWPSSFLKFTYSAGKPLFPLGPLDPAAAQLTEGLLGGATDPARGPEDAGAATIGFSACIRPPFSPAPSLYAFITNARLPA